MIRINCKALARMLTDMRRALGIIRSSNHPVSITTDRQSMMVRVSNAEASVACQFSTARIEQTRVVLPMRVFAAVPSAAKQELQIEPAGDSAILSWLGASGVQTTLTEKCLADEAAVHEVNPEWLISNDRQLGRVLQQAANIADPESTRYSLGCIRLRGSDGQVAATDSRQVYLASGFAFPVDEVLVPGAALRRLPCLGDCFTISVGRTPDWLSIRCAVGPLRWLVDLKIQQKGRFPNVDQCMPALDASRTELTIGESDAQYLVTHLKRLQGNSNELQATTLELARDRVLNAQLVQLRFRPRYLHQSPEQSAPLIGLNLNGSTFDGLPKQIVLDTHNLLTALQTGFRKFCIQSVNLPMFCIEGSRRYVCTTMHESLFLIAAPNMQILSTVKSLAVA